MKKIPHPDPYAPLVIYTDGSKSSKLPVSGSGFVADLGNDVVMEYSSSSPALTSNQAELHAVVHALTVVCRLKELTPFPVFHMKGKNHQFNGPAYGQVVRPIYPETKIVVFSDSMYVVNGMEAWVWGWLSRKWKTSEDEAPANLPYWKALVKLVHGLEVEFRHVPGHAGIIGNERAHTLAGRGATMPGAPFWRPRRSAVSCFGAESWKAVMGV